MASSPSPQILRLQPSKVASRVFFFGGGGASGGFRGFF